MFFGILTLATALIISAVAIYYSVAGLVTIFAAAAVPIIIMGSALETAKLVTAVWLHWYWNQTAWWLKTYLVSAVIVLMLITSMGIFGFLSRAHIEQTTNAAESLSTIERINTEISRLELQVSRAESSIQTLQSRTADFESNLQNQIDQEQNRIDLANSRIEPLVREQQSLIQNQQSVLEERSALLLSEVNQIDQSLEQVNQLLDSGDIPRIQSILGITQDGILGPNTRNSIQQYQIEQNSRKSQLLDQISQLENSINPTIDQARQEISRLRQSVEQQISQSNSVISRLQEQIGQNNRDEIESQIEIQNERIQSANSEIEKLISERFEAERSYRLIEAEVGPIKYIAEFVYGRSDQDLLEEAVRWVIIIIIFVFDPLAVLLLIASQYTFEFERQKRKTTGSVDNHQSLKQELDQHTQDNQDQKKTQNTTKIENNESYDQSRIKSWIKKEELLKEAKQFWKEQNPEETIKFYKTLYLQGKIDSLPWEEQKYTQNSEQTEKSLFKKLQESRLKK